MIISRVKLTNWKNFQNVDVELKNRVFVVGANASGKSNFLDVFRFMRDIVKQAGGLQYAVDQRGWGFKDSMSCCPKDILRRHRSFSFTQRFR